MNFSYDFILLSTKVKTICNFTFYRDKKEFEETKIDSPSVNDCTSIFKNKKLAFITLNFIFYIGNTDIRNYIFNIQHELNHVYQQIMKNGSYTNNTILNREYAFAATNINDKDEINRNIANIIYLSQPYEQDSFVNELYYEIGNDLEKNIDINTYKNSKTYERLKQLNSCVSFFKENKSKIIDKITLINDKLKTNLKYSQLLKNGEKGIKRFKEKIAHVFARVMNNNMIHESFVCDGNWKQQYFINEGYKRLKSNDFYYK